MGITSSLTKQTAVFCNSSWNYFPEVLPWEVAEELLWVRGGGGIVAMAQHLIYSFEVPLSDSGSSDNDTSLPIKDECSACQRMPPPLHLCSEAGISAPRVPW